MTILGLQFMFKCTFLMESVLIVSMNILFFGGLFLLVFCHYSTSRAINTCLMDEGQTENDTFITHIRIEYLWTFL